MDVNTDTDGTDVSENESEQSSELSPDRRSFLRSAMVASAALSAGAASIGTAVASGDGEHGNESGNEEDQSGDTLEEGDANAVTVLNFALVLERLEATFYVRGLEMFNEDDFRCSEDTSKSDETAHESVYDRLTAIRDHEQSHVDYFVSTINELGGDPVSEDQVEFAFEFETPTEFLETAQVLETTGVSAYDGAISLLEEDDLVTAAATVATVEARHSAFLNSLVGMSPFPDAFDEALSMEEVLAAADPFITSELPEI